MAETEQILLTARDVETRYGGVSRNTLFRWQRDPELDFPRPVVIRGRHYWRVEELAAWEDCHLGDTEEGAR